MRVLTGGVQALTPACEFFMNLRWHCMAAFPRWVILIAKWCIKGYSEPLHNKDERVKWWLALCLVLVSPLTMAQGMQNCGDVFDTEIGPFDYASQADRDKILGTVERRHFTDKVANLISGETGSEIMPDLAYTLGKFPNHYRALQSLMRYEEKLGGKLPQLPNKKFTQSVDCYFQRAFQFRPQDHRLYQLYGIYFYKRQDFNQAVAYFKRAESLMPSAEIFYNLGLAYVELNDLANARQYAQKAYAAQFPLQGLKNKLDAKGIKIE